MQGIKTYRQARGSAQNFVRGPYWPYAMQRPGTGGQRGWRTHKIILLAIRAKFDHLCFDINGYISGGRLLGNSNALVDERGQQQAVKCLVESRFWRRIKINGLSVAGLACNRFGEVVCNDLPVRARLQFILFDRRKIRRYRCFRVRCCAACHPPPRISADKAIDTPVLSINPPLKMVVNLC